MYFFLVHVNPQKPTAGAAFSVYGVVHDNIYPPRKPSNGAAFRGTTKNYRVLIVYSFVHDNFEPPTTAKNQTSPALSFVLFGYAHGAKQFALKIKTRRNRTESGVSP